MISFHSLLFLLLMRKKKKIDSHHADHNNNNNKKKKNTSDAMTFINQQQEETHTHCSLHAIPMCPCVYSLIGLHVLLLLLLQRRHKSFQTQASHFFGFLIAFAFRFPSLDCNHTSSSSFIHSFIHSFMEDDLLIISFHVMSCHKCVLLS